ncbi:MAG TPA: sigma-54 dependent transcriptional regulator [Candidatus Ozemobacteraceae bacterium]|nr:sigma-54 dependent transcriptional regulator [Candidatus Ozemobacteraceae bacterium]
MSIEILIVDDEDMIRFTLRESLERQGYRVLDFANGEDFLAHFQQKGGDIVMLDIRLPGMSGLDVLKELKHLDASTPVIMMTAYGDVETAVTAMKLGATDYISKPYSLAEVHLILRNLADHSILKRQLSHYQEKIDGNYTQLLGDNVKMKTIREHISMAAQSDKTTVLIRGESGTGKELVARQIHNQSARRNKPFIDVNAAAVTGTLLESELFGHEKGAFTDAQKQKKGVFELADGGSLFLDEIGDLSPSLQAKLLRVLQEKRFRRVGGSVDISVDVRIIAATNADLEKQIEAGTWRRDLFYRLNVFTIQLPPLRDRRDDVLLLARFFLDQYNREFSKKITGFAPETTEILMSYPFPGNVRELKNLIERATLLETSALLKPGSLPEEMRSIRPRVSVPVAETAAGGTLPAQPWLQAGFSFKDYIDGIEKQVIEQALTATQGKKGDAARLLGMTRFAFRHQLKKHNIADDE